MGESPPPAPEHLPKIYERDISGRHIIVTEPRPLDVDVTKVDVSRFGVMADQVEFALSIIAEWVRMPSIYDGFTDHEERLTWEARLDPVDRTWLNDHHYRGNSWSVAFTWLQALPSKLSADPALAERVKMLTQPLSDIKTRTSRALHEGTVARDMYVAAVDELDEMARSVLAAIAET